MILGEIPMILAGMTKSRMIAGTAAVLIMLAALHLYWAAGVKRSATVIATVN